MAETKIITIKEHENIFDDEKFKNTFFDKENEKWKDVKHCKLFDKNEYANYKNSKDEILPKAYFIGIDWLKEDEYALCVKPKMDNVDVLHIFMSCFKHPSVANKINKDRGKGEDTKPIYTKMYTKNLYP